MLGTGLGAFEYIFSWKSTGSRGGRLLRKQLPSLRISLIKSHYENTAFRMSYIIEICS